jgi:glycosyltransferase involved in cell wall biosynthesis
LLSYAPAPVNPDRDAARRPLRVGLNLVFLTERSGGAGRYATELPGALLAAEPDTEVHVFVSRDAPAQLRREPWADAVRWVTLPLGVGGVPLHVLAQFTALAPLAAARGLDVLHSPANTGPVTTPRVASVVSLLDLIWLHHPDEWEPSRLVQLRMSLLARHCARRADRVFAISQAAAEDIAANLGVARSRIEVTPLGVQPAPPATDSTALRERLDLQGRRVVLCVAQKRPYKNLATLIRALPALDSDVTLVLPGAPTEHERELRELALELGVGERMRFPPWLSEPELDELYELSDVFALPSLIEGFGLPVLEAMAHRVPVACSNVSALPEVVGDAALLFDPSSQEQVTDALRRLLGDRMLAQRLIAAGEERVRMFSWRRTGEASLAGYRHAIGACAGAGGH